MSDIEELRDEEAEDKKLNWFYYDYDGSIYRSDILIAAPFQLKYFQAKIEHWNDVLKAWEPPMGDAVKKIFYKADQISAEDFWSEFFNE